MVIYLLGPTIEGKVGMGPIDGELDIDPGDVFDALDGAFLATYGVEKDGWGALFDLIYMDLSSDVTGDRGLLTGEIGLKQTIFGAYGTYRLNDNLQVLAGGRYVDLTTKLSLNLQSPVISRLARAGLTRSSDCVLQAPSAIVGLMACWATSVVLAWVLNSPGS